MKLRILSVPEGFAPLEIREQWVGVEIPLMTFESVEDQNNVRAQFPPDSPNAGGWLVWRADAVAALQAAGKHEAARFWDGFEPLGLVLQFHTRAGELIL